MPSRVHPLVAAFHQPQSTRVFRSASYFWDRLSDSEAGEEDEDPSRGTCTPRPSSPSPTNASSHSSAESRLRRLRKRKAFWTGLLWGARMGWAAVLAGIVCVVAAVEWPALGDLLGTYAFLVPLSAVLIVGKTFKDTFYGSRDGLAGTVYALVLGIPQVQLVWLVLPGNAGTAAGETDGNYGGRVGLVAVLMFLTVAAVAVRESSPPLQKKIQLGCYLFLISAVLSPQQSALGLLKRAGVLGVLFGLGTALATLSHAVTPRRSSQAAARKQLASVVKHIEGLATLLFQSYVAIDESSLTSAALIDLRIGSNILLTRLTKQLDHAVLAAKNAALTFPYLFVTRDVSSSLQFLAVASRAAASLAGIRRALLMHPIFTSKPTIWSGLRGATIPETQALSTSLDQVLREVARGLRSPQHPANPSIEANSQACLAQLDAAYTEARRHVFYNQDASMPEPELASRLSHIHPHHLYLFHLIQLCNALWQLNTASRQIVFVKRCSLASDLRRLFEEYVPAHRLHADFVEFFGDLRTHRDALIRAALLGLLVVCLSTLTFVPAVVKEYPKAFWAPITAVFITDIHSTASTYRTGIQRLVGTTVGAIMGFASAWAALGLPWLSLLFGFITAFVSGYARSSPRWMYAGMVSGFTSQVIIFTGIYASTSDDVRNIVYQRIEMTLLGVITTVLGGMIWPTSARSALITSAMDNFRALESLTRQLFSPFSRHIAFSSSKEYASTVDAAAGSIKGSIASQFQLTSMAEEEPVLWRHDFDAKVWTSLLAAQSSLLTSLSSLKSFIDPDSPSHRLFIEWLKPEIDELREETMLVLDNLGPLVSQTGGDSPVWTVIRLPSSTISTPIQIAECVARISARFGEQLVEKIKTVSRGAAPMVSNAEVLPITAFVTSLHDVVGAMEQLWQSTYEIYSRNRFES
ncbi:MAG: FUSC family protein [archaeon]|nr:FUSC family protein [archaeon]